MAQPFPSSKDFLAMAGNGRVIDLSYTIRGDLPLWPGDPDAFAVRTESTIEQDGYFTRSFSMLEHYATHLDAPAHFIPGGATVDEITPQRLLGPAVVLDVRDAAARNPDHALDAGQLARWEAAHGLLPPRAIVLLRTGWASRWPDAARYANKDGAGTMHFPGFGADAVRVLIERDASGIGIDTMSVDIGSSQDYPVHRLALQAGLYHLENLADLSAVPEAGAFLLVAPIKLQGGSGGPCRVFAIVP
jgi:kynurenine formamidase